jgi:LacI family transcriptional regulator
MQTIATDPLIRPSASEETKPEGRPGPPTIKDIARLAELNVSTVSRALSGAYGVNEETRERVLEIARKLGYRPNLIARGLVTGQSRTIGLLISDIRNVFFAEIARGAEDSASAAGYDVILCNSDLKSEKQWGYIQSLAEKRVAGIIMNSVASLSKVQQAELAKYRIPIVLLNRQTTSDQMFSTATANNFMGGELAANYLVGLGHRVIAHITGPRQHGNLADRCRGFVKGCRSSSHEITAVVIHGQHTHAGGYEMTNKLLSQRRDVTAIFAANDIAAFGALRALQEHGLSVPDDISLVGFDNVEISGIISPPLTTIDQPRYELGGAAVDILLKRSERPGHEQPEHRLFGVGLVERKSCRQL